MRGLALALTLSVAALQAASATESRSDSPQLAQYQRWVTEMKQAPRGPFDQVLWFCRDGSTQPPRAYACQDHGGGHQHGELNEEARELQQQGYYVATLLAGIDAPAVAAQDDFADRYGQLLVQHYLMAADNGWVFRRALFYRGAIQEEDESAGAQALLEYLIAQPRYIDTHFLGLRTGVRLLPHGAATASQQQVRQLSAALSDSNSDFMPLRAKIHGAPDAADATRVREYAARTKNPALAARFQQLAEMIDAVYTAQPLEQVLEEIRPRFSAAPWLLELLEEHRQALLDAPGYAARYRASGALLAALRENLPRVNAPVARLRLLDLSLQAEAEHLRSASALRPQITGMTRAQRLELIAGALDAAFGVGLLKQREREAMHGALAALDTRDPALGDYLATLNYLGRVPGWATQNLRFFFQEPMLKLAEVEPGAKLFIQDQLRGSPLLFYSSVLDGLVQDGNRLAGVQHRIFGETVGVGFNALNPGIARGVLHAADPAPAMDSLDSRGIYLLPETVSDLPPVAGILTAGEGNPLSHVQLLARNLGIPNVAVAESMTPRLRGHDGEEIVMAVSPAGLVELNAFDDQWADFFASKDASAEVVIRPDLDKLDLTPRQFISLDELRAEDSGRTVGPKAAKLGELRKAFPGAVAPGLAIPFGMFRAEVLERDYRDSGGSVFDWMVGQYRALEAMPADSAERAARTEAFRAELHQLILDSEPSAAFKTALRTAMQAEFGELSTGVFVRSDTNVEDLPGFTGAGLNLTLPNVVGFEALVAGIRRVWASPFTARAFAWRQSHMLEPEHVYTSILLLEAVPSDKSGVLVTQDLDSGDMGVLSVAVNEGLGGAVDGQAAESLRVDTRSGAVRLMGTATAALRRVVVPAGGIAAVAASGADRVLQAEEIQRLIRFARDELPQRFPRITDDAGRPAAADIEFGFLNGELRLFQIRPFLESKGARSNRYLIEMDRALQGVKDQPVDLQELPQA